MSQILGGAIPHLETAMRFRIARQAALSANVANADTPNYRRVDLSFDGALAKAAGRIERTHARHLGAGGASDYRLERGPRGQRPDGNGVQLDREVVELTRNAGAFEKQAAVLTRLLAIRRLALSGEGR